eukprot:17578-Heterococcus_DN1.PRE.9
MQSRVQLKIRDFCKCNHNRDCCYGRAALTRHAMMPVAADIADRTPYATPRPIARGACYTSTSAAAGMPINLH